MSTESLLPPIGTLLGAFYFGTILSTVFYGITCMQTFFYYVHYPNDPLRTKVFVAILWALNTIHETLSISGTYKYAVAGVLNQSAFLNFNPDLVLQLLFTAIVAVPSQGFLVYRIYVFSEKNIIMPIVWVPISIIELGGTTLFVQKALYTLNGNIQAVPISMFEKVPYTTFALIVLSAAAVADVLIAVCMTFLLVRARQEATSPRTVHVLQRLVVFSLNTGIWTAAFALLILILLHSFPTNVLYAIPAISVCSVYCNTTLGNLNARSYIMDRERTHTVGSAIFAHSSWFASQGTDGQEGATEMTSPTQEGSAWKAAEVTAFSDANQLRSSVGAQV